MCDARRTQTVFGVISVTNRDFEYKLLQQHGNRPTVNTAVRTHP